MVTIGFDIGGTNTRAGVVDKHGDIVDVEETHTPHDADGLTHAIVELVEVLRRRHSIGAVGLAVAGFLDPDCEVVRFAPHLPWQDNAPVKQLLEEELELPVCLEHDANAAAWGEYLSLIHI